MFFHSPFVIKLELLRLRLDFSSNMGTFILFYSIFIFGIIMVLLYISSHLFSLFSLLHAINTGRSTNRSRIVIFIFFNFC